LEVDTILEALRQHLGGAHEYALHCPRAVASIGSIVSCLFLVGACSGFYSLDLALISCQLFSDILLGASMLREPVGSAHIVVVWLLQINCTESLSVQLSRQLGSSMLLCFPRAPT